MKRRVLLRPAADRDLDAQADYIAVSSGEDAARRFYRAAELTFQLIAGNSGIGRRSRYRNTLLAETRMFRMREFRKHLVFYRPLSDGAEIVRVIHGARDIESLFEE